MHISIQSVEITHEKLPYRFIVKKVHTVGNEIRFQCWAPEDNLRAKELLDDQVIQFEWDQHQEDLKHSFKNDQIANKLKQAIRENFQLERA